MSPRISLLISSLDGTILAPDGTLTERSRAAVQRLADADIAFALTTSRPSQRLRPLIGPLGLSAPLAALGGGLIVGPDLGVIVEHRMDRRGAETTVAVLTAGGFDVWLYTADQWLVRSAEGPHVEREAAVVGAAPTVVESFDGALSRAVRVVGISDDRFAVIRTTAEVRRRCGGGVLVMNEQPNTIDVTDPYANSSEVVMALADAFDVPVERVAAIGGGAADVPMLEQSGLGIALGHARPEVQRAARFVAPSNADEGFATAVDEFVFGSGAG